jgi:crotonobetainyl-CoA:carnitine CoA-transferase CaiB-like acyl-CoA transferase
VYPSAGEDCWVAISVSTDEEWAGFKRALGNPAWVNDSRFHTEAGRRAHQAEVDALVSVWTRALSASEASERLQREGVAAAPSKDLDEVVKDPQLAHRGFFNELQHKAMGPLLEAGIPGLLTDSGKGSYFPAPLLGEHNQEVLVGLLGLEPDELARLEAEQVVY